MKNLAYLIGILFLITTSCFNKEASKVEEISYTLDTNMVIIKDSLLLRYLERSGLEYFELTNKEVYQVNKILEKAIEDEKFSFLKEPRLASLNKYYRQYYGYINDKNERIVRVNAFCQLLPTPVRENGEFVWRIFDWKHNYLMMDDGGACYWGVKINLKSNLWFDLRVNGLA